MRIHFYCQYFPPEMGAPAARTFEHARYWAAQGHEVTVVCGVPNHPDGIVPLKYRGTPIYRETIEGVKVVRCWFFTTPNRGVVKRSFSFLSFMISSTLVGTFFSGKCDLIVATSPQMLCALGGYVASRFKRRPFILEIRDLWPKQIVDLGAVTNPIIIGGLSWIEMFMYRKARAVVTVAEATRQEIAGRGIPIAKLYTITNGINESFFMPRDRMAPLRARHGWGKDIVVMYIGTHGLSQGLMTILETAAMLRDRTDIRFVFAGTGAEREMLMEEAKRMALPRFDFLPFQTKDDMPEFYAAADICLVPLKKRDVFLYNIPSKMFEIMACGRPILLGAKGQSRQLLEEAQAGIAVEPEDPNAYRDAIVALADDAALRQRFGEQGRAHVVAHYSRSQKAQDFLACMEEVLGGR
ncbi:MAG: glycosyltransferase family 4 protein [Candidatus Hydrogenedentes bacterium]|nr:glycosyltransferase family 4 protein [Candidatus Hydrogenedentota bacterium]